MNLAHGILGISAARYPDRVALVGGWGQYSFGELEALVADYAEGLIERGVRPGDRVALMMNNSPDVVALFFAVLRAGGVVVAVNVMLRRAELSHLLADSGSVIVICDGDVLGVVQDVAQELDDVVSVIVRADEAPDGASTVVDLARPSTRGPVERNPDDPAMFVYTSGTTGTPKGVVMSHFWMDYVAVCWVNVFKMGPNDRTLVTSPFFYIIGSMLQILTPFRIGASAVLEERFRPLRALKLITTHRPSALILVPTAVLQMIDEFDPTQHDVSSVRTFFVSGGAPGPTLRESVESTFGWEVREIYGMTEAHILAASSRGVPMREGWIGVPGGNLEITIVDDDGVAVPAGERGEILARGDTVASGYWDGSTVATRFDGAWFPTGDIGVQDADGYLKIVDRKKQMIITGGANIYPAEVENILRTRDDVANVVLVGIDDEKYGQVPWAVVEPARGANIDPVEFAAWSKQNVASFKSPRRVLVVDEFPVLASGKIARAAVEKHAREIAGSEHG